MRGNRIAFFQRLPLIPTCLIGLAVVVACSIAGRRAFATDPEALTVMTWNLEWFYDEYEGDNFSKLAKQQRAPSRTQWDWKRDQVAARIAQIRPTFAAFQEVENRRVLWYLTRALERNHSQEYRELGIEGRDHFTEQDVGAIFQSPADVTSISQFRLSERLRGDARFSDVTKHLVVVLDFPVGEAFEQVTIVNVHLRARAEGEPTRVRQARTLQHWLAAKIRAGENVILLGDFNTEQRGEPLASGSDLWIAAGRETADPSDDLFDLNLRLPADHRQTHLLPNRQFDRILCSRSLLEDDPTRADLVFDSIVNLRDLAIQGDADLPDQHWGQYWKIPAAQRDLSDHYPIMATFHVR